MHPACNIPVSFLETLRYGSGLSQCTHVHHALTEPHFRWVSQHAYEGADQGQLAVLAILL